MRLQHRCGQRRLYLGNSSFGTLTTSGWTSRGQPPRPKGSSSSVGDVTDGWVRERNLGHPGGRYRRLPHLGAPAMGSMSDELTGTTGDDCFAITGSNYPVKNDVSGNVIGVSRQPHRLLGPAIRSALIIAGVGNTINNITFGTIRGSAERGQHQRGRLDRRRHGAGHHHRRHLRLDRLRGPSACGWPMPRPFWPWCPRPSRRSKPPSTRMHRVQRLRPL